MGIKFVTIRAHAVDLDECWHEICFW